MWKVWTKWSSSKRWTSTTCHSRGRSIPRCTVPIHIWRCAISVWRQQAQRIWTWPSRRTLHGIVTSTSSMTWPRIWSSPSKQRWTPPWMRAITHLRLFAIMLSPMIITRHGKILFNAVWPHGVHHIPINNCSRHHGMCHSIVSHTWRLWPPMVRIMLPIIGIERCSRLHKRLPIWVMWWAVHVLGKWMEEWTSKRCMANRSTGNNWTNASVSVRAVVHSARRPTMKW